MAAKNSKRSVLVYADWVKAEKPMLMGVLHATLVRGKEIFSFEYEDRWLKNGMSQILDPDLQLFAGPQYLRDEKTNFGIFLDSSPDRWGRMLMKRREAAMARQEGRKEKTLFETDYLLGVFDGHRMGALRFKESEVARLPDGQGNFLNDNVEMASPPWTSIKELEHACHQIENTDKEDKNMKWLNMLLAPGSSLGGARPKAGVLDNKGRLWIAKFPSRSDSHDVGAWEMVVHDLAVHAGLNMANAMTGKFYSKQHTFLTQRFDRTAKGERIHFASAMTLLGHTDGTNFQDGVSYLDLAGFIMQHGAQANQDLEELWRRIVFSICVTNTDDHLRNHGFLLTERGWTLSPAFDINPNETGAGLSINISSNDNSLDLDLALEVAPYFRISEKKAHTCIGVVKKSVGQWRAVATKHGLSKSEQALMARAFRV